jgi:hypothetical protein
MQRRRLPSPSIARRDARASTMGNSLLNMPRMQDVFNPLAFMLMGPRGRGKTLALDALGAVMRERYTLEDYTCKVYANFPTSDADLADPRVMDWVTDWGNYTVSDGVLLADEIQGEAASAKWNSNINFSVVQALTQVRKKRLECAFTTQYPRGIEKGLLEQVDFFIEVRKMGDGFGLAFAVHDWKDLMSETPRRHRPFPPFWWEADWYYAWFGTKQFFGHYATFGQQIPRYMAAKDQERWERLTQDEWRRHGYELETVEDNEDLTQWSGTEAGRTEAPRALVAPPAGWLDVLKRRGEFGVSGMHTHLRDQLPSDGQTKAGFKKLLERSGFVVEGDFAHA